MSSNTNFPTFTDNMNFNSSTIKEGGQKVACTVWTCCWVNVKVPLTGEWYWEYITDSFTYAWMGIGKIFVGTSNQHNNGFGFTQNGEYRYNGSNQYGGSGTSGNIGTGDIVGVYVNAGVVKVYVNNTLDFTFTQNLSALATDQIYPWAVGSSNTTVNFGQDSSFLGVKTAQGNTDKNGFGDFYYTPPGDALALCSANTPIDSNIDPAQTDTDYPGKQMGVLTWTGSGSTRSLTGLGFKPDLIFIKSRSYGSVQQVYDSTRGGNKQLYPSETSVEADYSYLITSFDTDGFSMGNGQTDINYSSRTFCGWCFRANGGTTVSNGTGSITSTVQANQAAGFSIVSYTGGDGSWGSSDTFGHGLSAAPEFMLFKERNNTDAWTVFHHAVGNGGGSSAAHNNLRLDNNDALYTNQSYKSFAGVMPTSTLVTVDGNTTNSSGSNHIAYIWHGVDGYSKFGSYEGNANANGELIDCGFRPRFLVIKNIDASDNWVMLDSEREPNNPTGEKILLWDTTDTEYDSANVNVDFLARGFKLRNTDNKINSSHTFVYMAWGDIPFKYNNAF